MSQDEVAKCPQCGGPLRPYHEGPLRGHRLQWQRCDCCGYYVKPDLFDKVLDEAKELHYTVGNLGTMGLGLVCMGIFAIIILAVLGQFQNASIWPSGNQSKITNQLSQRIAAANGFLSILIVMVATGGIMVVIGLVHHALKSENEEES